MKQLKKILSFILCTVMCVSLMQATIFAANSGMTRAEMCKSGRHSFTGIPSCTPATELSCTEPESYYCICDFCDAVNYDIIVPIGLPLGHDWGKWTSRGSQEHARVCKTDPSHIEREPHNLVIGACAKCNYRISFSDVNKKAWSYESIMYVAQNDIMKGVSATKFAPDTDTSRAMVVTILWRLEGSPVVDQKISFKDVEEDTWYTEAVRWAYYSNVVIGYSMDKFGPDDPITREQLMIILGRYAFINGYCVTGRADISNYTDVSKVSDWARDGIEWGLAKDLIICKNGIIDPLGIAKRDQVAYAIHKFCINAVDYYE